MKKLLLAFGILALSVTSCQSESEDYVTGPVKVEQKQTAKTSAREAGFDPYLKDGSIYITVKGEVYYMGEPVKWDESAEAKEVIDLYLNRDGETSRRKGTITCSVNSPTGTISFVTVSGNGQPNSYWVVYDDVHGIRAFPYPGPKSFWDCTKIHFEAIFG